MSNEITKEIVVWLSLTTFVTARMRDALGVLSRVYCYRYS